MRVCLCIPTITAPYQQTQDAIEASLPILKEAGHTVGVVSEVGSAYISWARAQMTAKALRWGAEAIVYIDHDLSWRPRDLLTLVETPGDVVAGTYRFKDDVGDFMGRVLALPHEKPRGRADGCILMRDVPAGFLRITPFVVECIRQAFPELICDDSETGHQFVDLFNHGAHKGIWYGEDYAFCRRWREIGGSVWLIPNLTITHHTKARSFAGNYHEWLMCQPGGVNDPHRCGESPSPKNAAIARPAVSDGWPGTLQHAMGA